MASRFTKMRKSDCPYFSSGGMGYHSADSEMH